MKEYTVIVNGCPMGTVKAASALEARQIARGDTDLNPDNVPMDFIWAELEQQ
jgi:hypothetical protein